MYSAIASRALAREAKDCWWYISFFNDAKKDSATALSPHIPVRPTDSLTSSRRGCLGELH